MINYDSLAKSDWQQLDEDFKLFARSVKEQNPITDYAACRANGIHPPFPITDECFDVMIKTDDFFSEAPNVDRSNIAKILIDFPDDVVDQICTAIMPTNIEKLWTENGYHFHKFEHATKVLKALNVTVRDWSPKIHNVPTNCPEIIKESFVDGLETSKAYIRLLREELQFSRYTVSNGQYKELTRHPYWKDVINLVVDLVDEAFKKAGFNDKNLFSNTAVLFQAAYPWCWGQIPIKTATRRIRHRYKYSSLKIEDIP